jgi:cytochrome c nitrite reductase small subunit
VKLPIIVGIVMLVIVVGLGMNATNFTAYLGNDPTTCNNCHVMDYVYEGWYHSSHSQWTTCNDCHTPHELVPKYIVKAYSGFNHVTHFVTGNIPVPIRAKPATKTIIQNNCIRCHSSAVDMINDGKTDSGRLCFDCHRTVSHGERGISIYPEQDIAPYFPKPTVEETRK